MKTRALCGLVVALLLVAAEGQGDAKKDQDRLQGTWTLTAEERDGNKTAAEDLKKRAVKLTFKGDKVTVQVGDRQEHAETFTLDPSKKPKEIDIADKAKGIYELDGDTLKLRISHAGKRPEKFDGQTGQGEILGTLKRDKP
jgi:uncharacterized protein (TIGR03067 family)